jgi:sugar/nucleoside kinase (ribokinase family)
MKVTLIGHFCVDVFHRSDGREEKKLGGIYHAIAAMANLASDQDRLFPVFGAGEAEIDEITSAFSEYPNVDLSGMFVQPNGSNVVHYFDERPNECVENISAPIPFETIKPFLAVDGVYINMISGSDISLETLDHIRLAVRGRKTPIHFDMHCLTLGINPDGTRFRRAMSDWRRWCFMIDSVQMNEEEARGITLEQYGDEAFAKQMMPLMVKAFVVTRGKMGATVYRDEHKVLKRTDVSGDANENPVSVIGSGDIFGAVFLYAFLKKSNYAEAAAIAHAAAAYSTRFSVSDKHRELRAQRIVP